MKTLLVLAVPVLMLAGCASTEEESSDGRRTQTTQGVGIGFGDNYVREGDPLSEHQQYIGGGL